MKAKGPRGPEDGDKLANYLTMVGHMCADMNQGALAATLPFLVAAYGYSYASVAMLVFAANIASAVIQPLFGWIGDKRPSPWFMAAGVFLAGLGMSGIGLLDGYWATVASAMVAGIGVAMFHPEGGRLANLAAGEHKAGGMSIFAVGGNIGFFIGPMLAAVSMSVFGVRGTFVFMFPAAACAILLLAFNGRFRALGEAAEARAALGGKDSWGKFGLVMGVLSLRSIIQNGLLAFIPLFLVGLLGQTEAAGSLALSAFSVAGACSTIISGRVSERVGASRLAVAGFVALAAFSVAFAMSRSLPISIAITMLLALSSSLFYPSTVALGMSYVPRHLGMASGLSYGVAVSVGGIAEPFLGMAGDAWGLEAVMLLIAGVAVFGAALGIVVKRVDERSGKPKGAAKESGI